MDIALEYLRCGAEAEAGRLPRFRPEPMPQCLSTPPSSEIDLWLAHLPLAPTAEVVRRLARRLPSQEQERAARFKVEPPRWQFVAARTVLRTVLGAYLSVPPHDLELQFGPHGKPRVDERHLDGPFHFNLSHAGNVLLIGVSVDAEIGVDVETCRGRAYLREIAERNFHPDETALLSGAEGDDAVGLFHRLWTLKEAYLKALGEGLRYPMQNINFARIVAGGAPGRLLTPEGRWRCGEVLEREALAAAAVWQDLSAPSADE